MCGWDFGTRTIQKSHETHLCSYWRLWAQWRDLFILFDAQLKSYITYYMALCRHRSSNRAAILNVQAPGSDNSRTTSPNTGKRQTVLIGKWHKFVSSKTTNVFGHLLHHLVQLQCTSSPPGILRVDCCSINLFISCPMSKHDPSCLFCLCSQIRLSKLSSFCMLHQMAPSSQKHTLTVDLHNLILY